MADLSESGQTFIAAHGGIGGKVTLISLLPPIKHRVLLRTAWKVKNSRLNLN